MPSLIFKTKFHSFPIYIVITLELVHWNISCEVERNIRGISKPSTNKTCSEIYKQWIVTELISLERNGFQEKFEWLGKTEKTNFFFFATDYLK